MTKPHSLPAEAALGPSGSLIDRAGIARDFDKTTRAVRNWETAGILPRPDCVFQGLPYWTRATYDEWKSRVLRGDFAGTARINNVRGRNVSA